MPNLSDQTKKIDLGGREIAYCLRISARAKCLRVAIKPGGEVFAVKPRFFPDFLVERFLRQKSGWILDKIADLKNKKNLLARGCRADFLRHARPARDLVLRKIDKFSRTYQFNFNRVSIRDQKTRWGSCSRRGNLSFNYRIALLPDRLADYIVAHELCHLKEMNHSRRFWDLLAVALPDCKLRRRELKRY
jgi:hypothetical protein